VVRVGLADRDAARLAVGDRATVSFDARPGTSVSGRIARIAASATPGSGAWEVEIRLEASAGLGTDGVASGLIGRVMLFPRGAATVRMIPLSALLEADGDSGIVYVIQGDTATGAVGDATARRLTVRVAFLDGERAAISGGLDSIRRVIVAGAGFLHDGALVAATAAPLVSP
jgi:multidrug efflux pump subunit AcrA (membrane-fusion protein)